MTDLNVVTIIGRLTRDPEVSYTKNEKAYANFAIATNRSWQSGGNKVEEVSFIDIQVWGRMAEVCGKYIEKGSQICVSGRIQQQRWKNKEGQNRSKIVVVANTVQFLSRGKQQQESTDNMTFGDGSHAPPPNDAPPSPSSTDINSAGITMPSEFNDGPPSPPDEDIPF
jgi:single-strand DNA-binding protein